MNALLPENGLFVWPAERGLLKLLLHDVKCLLQRVVLGAAEVDGVVSSQDWVIVLNVGFQGLPHEDVIRDVHLFRLDSLLEILIEKCLLFFL